MELNPTPHGVGSVAAPSPKRPGIRIKHWLLIVILSALVVDIGIRAVSFLRPAQPSAAPVAKSSVSSIAAERELLKALADFKASMDETTKNLKDQTESWQEYEKSLEANPRSRDSSERNIILL